MIYDDFDTWKAVAKRCGYRVRKMTMASLNVYYIAIDKTGIVGHFNTWSGDKGPHPENKPYGSLKEGNHVA